MQEPLCLVQNGADGVLSPNPAALEVLRGIGQPVVVVAIAGPYRTGKSFLMNRLAQRRTGFPLGPTVQPQTKGIWMWCLPHPYRPDTTLVLLDTEGLGDPNKGDSRNDAWIFTLALLLSSTLVFNSVGTIDHQALQHLGFVWAVRDFMLELSQDGQRITADEYLEHALRLQPGTAAAPRCCIRVRHGKRYRERVASEAVAAVVVAAVVEAAKAFDAWHEEQRRSFEEHQRQLEERLWREQRAVLELAGLIESALN